MAESSTIFTFYSQEDANVKRLHYHEARQRGTPDFPLEYHHLDVNHPRYQMPYHWHEEYEILLIKEGSFSLNLDDMAVTLGPGDAAFIAAGCLHGGLPQDCTYECVVFDMRLLLKSSERCKQQIGDLINRQITIQPCFRSGERAVEQAVQPLFEALRDRREGWELMTLGCLFRFLGECFSAQAFETASTPALQDDKRVWQLKTVFELIENDYAQPLTLDMLSAAVHMTPKYFCRFFKAATHRTPIDYLNYYRIEAACYEIAATDKNITEVALDVGLSNPSYFIRMFRKYKGVTPGQYLKAMRRNH